MLGIDYSYGSIDQMGKFGVGEIGNPYPATPAMAVGISDHIWTIEEIVNLKSK